MIVAVLGGSGFWVGGILVAAGILLAVGFVAFMVFACIYGAVLTFRDWIIWQPWYLKLAGKIPGYPDRIESRRQKQRDDHAKWKREREEAFMKYHNTSLFAEYDRLHPEPFDPAAHGDVRPDNEAPSDVSGGEA